MPTLPRAAAAWLAQALRTLRAVAVTGPRQARGGVLLHAGDESFWLDERILAVRRWKVI